MGEAVTSVCAAGFLLTNHNRGSTTLLKDLILIPVCASYTRARLKPGYDESTFVILDNFTLINDEIATKARSRGGKS